MYPRTATFFSVCLLLSSAVLANDPQKIIYPQPLPDYIAMAMTKSNSFLRSDLCYATKMDFTDNVSSALPKGLICFETSTGFYVYNGKSVTTLAGLGHPIRFKANINAYRDASMVKTSSWFGDNKLDVLAYSKVASKQILQYKVKASCDSDTQIRQEQTLERMATIPLLFKGEILDVSRDKESGKPKATINVLLEDPKYALHAEKIRSSLILTTFIDDENTALELMKKDIVEINGKVLSMRKGDVLDDYNCFISLDTHKLTRN